MSLASPPLVSSTARGTQGARDDWQTPAWLFGALDLEFRFNIDAAATAETAMVRNSYLCPEQDGLRCSWGGRGSRVWLNPPYGRSVGEWVAKARKEAECGAIVVVLIFSRTDTAWWHDHAMKASEIRFIRGRLRFLQDGAPKDPSPAPSCVLVFTPWSAGPPALRTIERESR